MDIPAYTILACARLDCKHLLGTPEFAGAVRCKRCGSGPYCSEACEDADKPLHEIECLPRERHLHPSFWAEALHQVPAFILTAELTARMAHAIFGEGVIAMSVPFENGRPIERNLCNLIAQMASDLPVGGLPNWRTHLHYYLGELEGDPVHDHSGQTFRLVYENASPPDGQEPKFSRVRRRRFRFLCGGDTWFHVGAQMFERFGPYPTCAVLDAGDEPRKEEDVGPVIIRSIHILLNVFARAGCMRDDRVIPFTKIVSREVIRRVRDPLCRQHIYVAFTTPWHAVSLFFAYQPLAAEGEPEAHSFHQPLPGVAPKSAPPRARFHTHPAPPPAWMTIPCSHHNQ